LRQEYLETKKGLTGIILSGGKSIRMGENKAFIEIEGVPIIHRIHTLFKNLFLETIIVTNQKDLFSNLESRIYNDLLPQRGVLGGLYTGLFFSSFQYSFCVACDMPFLKEKVIEYLIKDIEGYDVIVPRTTDGLQPLHAIYSKNCLGPIKKVIEQEKFKIIDIYPMVNVKIIKDEEFKYLDPMGESFININTPEELLYIIKRRKATA
jgi:molybdopterin-guanine dinucleotide biosynthesis protein A